MRFNGEWLRCDDNVVRPIVRAEILADDGHWHSFELLVDTGADRTVISANVLQLLNLEIISSSQRLGGVGGEVDSVTISTQLRWMRDDEQLVNFRGEYAAFMKHEALDMSVLGRDILGMFALIMDRQADLVAIIGGNHRYLIQQA